MRESDFKALTQGQVFATMTEVLDLDTATTPGFFGIGASTKGVPATGVWSNGLLEVMKRGNYYFQRISGQNAEMAVRKSNYGGATWGDWHILE